MNHEHVSFLVLVLIQIIGLVAVAIARMSKSNWHQPALHSICLLLFFAFGVGIFFVIATGLSHWLVPATTFCVVSVAATSDFRRETRTQAF